MTPGANLLEGLTVFARLHLSQSDIKLHQTLQPGHFLDHLVPFIWMD